MFHFCKPLKDYNNYLLGRLLAATYEEGWSSSTAEIGRMLEPVLGFLTTICFYVRNLLFRFLFF